MAEEAFTNPRKAVSPPTLAARTKVTVATLGLEEFKKRNNPQAEKFFADFKKKYGDDQPDPYAIYGYETMKLALDTLKAVGDKANDRDGGRPSSCSTKTKDRKSVLGEYSHRRERRHHAHRLRPVRDQGRRADVLEGHQGHRRAATSRPPGETEGGRARQSPSPAAS